MRGLAFFDLSALDMLRRVLRASGTPEAMLILPGARARRLIDILTPSDDRPDPSRGPGQRRTISPSAVAMPHAWMPGPVPGA